MLDDLIAKTRFNAQLKIIDTKRAFSLSETTPTTTSDRGQGLVPRLLVRPPTGTGSMLMRLPRPLDKTLPGLVTFFLDSGLLPGSDMS